MQRIDRTRRVGELIKRALPGIIREKCADWNLGLLSITATEVTKDLKSAIVFVTLLGSKNDQENVTNLLNAESFHFRKDLSSVLDLRHTPTIEFRYDASIENGVYLSKLIDGLKTEYNGDSLEDE
tara:strand:- start:1200 stop:1574 length:375 start_codon:yes stop_codon:yes gene_type:complete